MSTSGWQDLGPAAPRPGAGACCKHSPWNPVRPPKRVPPESSSRSLLMMGHTQSSPGPTVQHAAFPHSSTACRPRHTTASRQRAVAAPELSQCDVSRDSSASQLDRPLQAPSESPPVSLVPAPILDAAACVMPEHQAVTCCPSLPLARRLSCSCASHGLHTMHTMAWQDWCPDPACKRS